MTVALFGATGQLGRLVLRDLVARGHRVRVLVRSSLRLTESVADDDVVEGNVLDSRDVASVLRGCAAVVSTLGMNDISHPSHDLSTGLKEIIAGMKSAGIRRIIAVGGSGVLPHPDGGLYRDHEWPDFLRNVTDEHYRQWQTLSECGLDWTMACPAFFTKEVHSPAYRAAREALPPGSESIDLSALSEFLVTELAEGEYIGSRVGIVSDTLER